MWVCLNHFYFGLYPSKCCSDPMGDELWSFSFSRSYGMVCKEKIMVWIKTKLSQKL